MNSLPYLDPDRELLLNAGITLLILDGLAVTEKGRKTLTIEKIQSLSYLVTRPSILNRISREAGVAELRLQENEYFTISTISANVDPLFDREKYQLVLRFLASRELLTASYDEKDGFLFELNENGKNAASGLQGGYFSTVRKYLKQLNQLQSVSVTRLNKYLNSIFREAS